MGKRIRRNITPTKSTEGQANPSSSFIKPQDANDTAERTKNETTPTPEYWPTIPLPDFNDEDVNFTLQCEDSWLSCRGRCTQDRVLGGTEERLQCFCDLSCELFQDCCADYDQYCSSSGVSEQPPPDGWPWKCVRDYYLSKFLGVWMISFCPANWTEADIKEKCETFWKLSYDNRKDSLPVIDQKGNTYKNHYCARCHGIMLKELTFYNIQFKCDLPVPKQYKGNEILKFLFAYCAEYFWQPPEGVTRRYCHQIASKEKCLFSWPPTVRQKCLNGPIRLAYPKVPSFFSQNYFNPYCALCISKPNLACGPGRRILSTNPSFSAKPFSLVMDLDFSDHDTETSRPFKQKSCFEGYVYDFFLQVCRPGIKPSDITSHSLKMFSVSIWMLFRNVLHWRPVVNEINFKEAITNNLHLNETQISDLSIGNGRGPISTAVFNVNISATKLVNLSIETLESRINNFSIQLNEVNITFFKVAVKQFHCAFIETYNPNEYKFEENTVKVVKTGEILQDADFYTNETEWMNGSLVPIGILSVCKHLPVNCSGVLVRLTKEEYVFLSNGSLYRNISRDFFKPEHFQFINDTIWLCTNFSTKYEERLGKVGHSTEENNIVLVVLTYVGLSLSILGFALVLITYALFEELRTLPGIYLMNLCLAHLFLSLLYLATGKVDVKVACSIIAVLLHYLFLVSFTWMSIIAYETWKVFSKLRVQRRNLNRQEKRSHLLRRIALGWFCVLVFIVVCVALGQSNTVAFQYGGIKGCWINNTHASLYFFVLPVALSLSFNSVFFALTVRAIRKTNKQTQRATHQKQNRQTAAVFLKIFILMGFTWIFGFLKVLVSDYFEYPFIIFTTLQGLYVVLAFIFTARVKQMYCQLFHKKTTR